MILTGKRGIVFGASSKYSLGFHVAQAWLAAGAAKVTIACETEMLCQKIESTASRAGWWNPSVCAVKQCDVNNDVDLDRATEEEVDMILHSVAMAPTAALRAGSLSQYSRQEFLRTMETSSYSLLAIASRARFPSSGGSVTALTFDAARRVVPGYAAMAPAKAALETLAIYLASEFGKSNVRVNCISPGPVNTPAARALPNFQTLYESAVRRSASLRGVTPSEVASTATFLASDLASGITGQIIRVDCGEANGI